MAIAELREYRPPLTRAPGFLRFWSENVREAEEQPLNAIWKRGSSFTDRVKVTRLTFDGFADRSPIEGTLLESSQRRRRGPVLLHLHGYGGNRGRPTDFLGWTMLGFSVLAVDVRGQSGESADLASYTPGYVKGHMTKGIGSESTYYYRSVYMDCYRAVKCLLEKEALDATGIGAMGTSQGGGLSIVTAALHRKVAFALSGVPYLCNFERSVNVATAGPYLEVLDYLREHPEQEEEVYRTLSFFDAMNLAPMVSVPVIVSAGLQDTICPPSSVFAMFAKLASKDKELAVYPGVAHEDTGYHVERKMKWAVERSSRLGLLANEL